MKKINLKSNSKELLMFLVLFIMMFAASKMFAQHQIGHTQITFTDATRSNRAIQSEIYYPSTIAGNNVAIASGKFPVIVFGHGFVMAWSAYQNLWEEFVKRGYIMVFPRTEGSITGTNHQKFGWDLQFLVTAMQNEGLSSSSILYNGVAPETALMGHSMGGGAAFLAADSLCANGNTNLKTLIGLAPAESTSNGVSSINSALTITVPSLVLSGSNDGVTPPVDHHIPMYNNLASDCKSFINLLGGGHCYFANSNFNCDFGEGTSSTGISISRTEQHQVTFDFVNLWLDYTLKGDCSAFAEFNDSLQTSNRVNYNQDCNLPSFNISTSVSVCSGSSYTFPDGTTQHNIINQVVQTSNLLSVNCLDSVIITTVNVNPIYNTTTSATVCSGSSYTFPDGTTQNNITNQVVHTSNLQTVSGFCDSVIVTTVNVNPIYNTTTSATVCSGSSYTFPDGTTQNNITNQVVHTSNLQTVSGLCDSVIVTTVNVNPIYNTTTSATVCSGSSYTFPDGTTQNNITNQVVHTSNLQTVSGLCDSVIVTTVNVNPIYNTTTSATVCSGSSYTFPDGTTQNNITNQVVHTSNLQTVSGLCDSVIVTTVNVNPIYNTTTSATVCSGSSYTFPDGTTQNNITNQVVHTSNLQTVSGLCDSVIVTTVNVNPIYNTTTSATVCSGSSYTFPDGTTQNNITNQVVHTSNLQTVSGFCDSVIVTTVNVNPIYNTITSATVCSGSSYTFPDGTTQNNITNQVVHTSNLQTVSGLCDSVIVTTVDVTAIDVSINQTNQNTLESNAFGASYQWIDCTNNTYVSGEQNQVFVSSTNGSFAVQVTENGCIDTSSCVNIIGVGIEVFNGVELIELYPNPANNFVTLNFGKLTDVETYIVDVTGKIVLKVNNNNQQQQYLDLSNFSKGLYFVKIRKDDIISVIKLIKN